VERIQEELLDLASRLLGVQNLDDLREVLEQNPDLHFESSEEILQYARGAIERARAKVSEITDFPTPGECQVLPMSTLQAPDAPLGYYEVPSLDGSRPGIYFVNTDSPRDKLKLASEATIFHETFPGHHLQKSLAQTMDLPEFRRHCTIGTYCEGWALYAEKLAEEMDLYSTNLDRLGRLAQDLWRAARLVLDTGIHALGWSRTQAVAYARRETLISPALSEIEVDRFVVLPGQALAYKLGGLTFAKLRQEREKAEGKDFNRRHFHDTLLGSGAVSMATLKELVRG
jgi:uncharacterized protein (DUF885 family)